ncbi:MAG: hypothetical protein J6V25_07930 [Oscillospiraceae bacterium]|nr:hypothetical protein [Oscillospiraceae bacterium]
MAFSESRTQTSHGARCAAFHPITAEAAGAHPTYAAAIDVGANVKSYLSVQVASGAIFGDDVEQFDAEFFAGGQLDTETTLDDLEINATMFGHKYSAEDGEESGIDDVAQDGGYSFIEPFFSKSQGYFYRATCLYKVTPMQSSEKQEADTRKRGEFNPKMKVVSFKIKPDNTGAWRKRKDFKTEAEAKQYIETIFKPASTG